MVRPESLSANPFDVGVVRAHLAMRLATTDGCGVVRVVQTEP
jgi:hypothetical protein